MDSIIERVAIAIAKERGDAWDDLPEDKSDWIDHRGQFGGRSRDINEPFRSEYRDMAAVAIEALRSEQGEAMIGEWQPIETAPRDTYKVAGPTLILGHKARKWIRFGRWYMQERCWYYSGTNERSQYAQVKGDEPTHWMPLPAPPES